MLKIEINLKRSIYFITTILIIRLIFANILELSTDEAHYALYGLFLDWSYYDHPPLVGWLMFIAEKVFGYSNLALRLLPLLINSASLLLIYYLSKIIFNDSHIALRAVILAGIAPLPFIVGLAMIPETILVFFGLLAIILFIKLEQSSKKLWLWLSLAIVLGLCGISKYTAILIPITMLITALFFKKYQLIANWRIAPSIIISLLIITPVIYWNIHHDWISLKYQSGHVTDNQTSFIAAFNINKLLITTFGIFISYLPLFIAFLVWIFKKPDRKNINNFGYVLLIFVFTVITLAHILSGSLKPALPHWPWLAWYAFAPIAGKIYWEVSQNITRKLAFINTFTVSIFTSATLLFLIFIHVPFALPFIKPQQDYLAEVSGWQKAAIHAEELTHNLIATEKIIYVQNWTLASRIAWYVYSANPATQTKIVVLDGRFDQFDLWFGSPKKSTAGILIQYSNNFRGDINEYAANWGLQCQLIDEQQVMHNQNVISTFTFWQCNKN